jgi:uncharacterized membrane protein (DUF485 family)
VDTPSSQARNSKYGLILFSIYAVFYLGFVLVNAFAASWVEWVPFLGLNLAILWGFGLIALALILALVYGFLCWSPAAEASKSQSGDKL